MSNELTPEMVIRKHIKVKLKTLEQDQQTAIGHLRHERNVRNDYMGRAPLELLQNAIDRAECHISVRLCSTTRTFTVANDGSVFTYKNNDSESWSDFAALCAVNSSNKIAGQSIGNKGVGFRSIWEFCNQVKVVSKLSHSPSEYWGFRLYFPFKEHCLDTWEDTALAQKVRNGIAALPVEKGMAPSFYFPEYLSDQVVSDAAMSTEVTLEKLSDDVIEQLKQHLQELTSANLMFAGYCKTRHTANHPLNAEIVIDDVVTIIDLQPDKSTYHLLDVDTSEILGEENKHVVDKIDYKLGRAPQLTLAIPKVAEADKDGCFHCYLPTEMDSKSPLHIHGDFYLDLSRKHIDFEKNAYNFFLLQKAACEFVSFLKKYPSDIPLVLACKMLRKVGPFGGFLCNQFEDGKTLSSLLAGLVGASPHLSQQDLKHIYQLISDYIPEGIKYERGTTYDRRVVNYLSGFSRTDLKIVPIVSSLTKDDGWAATDYISLPLSNKKHGARLFCADRSSNAIAINAPNVVVTRWRFPVCIASRLKNYMIWQEYSASESVIRSIVRSQEETQQCSQREVLLKAASDVDPHKGETFTNWRFIGQDPYPSQRLLIPVHGGGWAPAALCFMKTEYVDERFINTECFFEVDEKRVQNYLGSDYRAQLLHWGVWNVVPLLNCGTITSSKWQLAKNINDLILSEEPYRILRALACAFKIWTQAQYFKSSPAVLNNVRDSLLNSRWLKARNGVCDSLFSPSHCFLSSSRRPLFLVPSLMKGELKNDEKQLLIWLGVYELDEESCVEKLSKAARFVVDGLSIGKQRDVSREYRAIVTRLNDLDEVPAAIPADFPLLVRDGVIYREAEDGEQVIFLTADEYRQLKGCSLPELLLWDVPRETSVGLASKMSGVERLNLVSFTSPVFDELEADLVTFEKLQTEILPKLFAYTEQADELNRDPNEDAIRLRWGRVDIRRTDEAKVGFKDLQGAVVSSAELAQELVLWSQTRSKESPLSLFLHANFDFNNSHCLLRLSRWFAIEIFQLPSLQSGFFMVLLNQVDSLDPVRVDAIRKAISTWLNKADEARLISELESCTGRVMNNGRWRVIDSYDGLALSYPELKCSIDKAYHWAIEQLNPSEKNMQTLQGWLDIHQAKLETFNPDYNLIISSLEFETVLSTFNFEPKSYVLQALGIPIAEFEQLDNKVDVELTMLRKVGFVVKQPTEHAQPAVCVTDRTIQSNGVTTGRLVATQSQDKRNQYAESRAQRGQNAEFQLAFDVAKQIHELNVDQQKVVFKIITNEYRRLTKLTEHNSIIRRSLINQTQAAMPENERQWADLVHIGLRWDGCGYDVLGYDSGLEKLLLIEMKRTNVNPPEIHLTENERKSILSYSSNEFQDSYPSTQWRIYVSYGGDVTIDCTEAIVTALNEHANMYKAVKQTLVAESWRLSLLIDSKNNHIHTAEAS